LQPIIWIDTPVSPNVLAWLYKRAAVMLVTPVYDGLNLTAKEFVLCSRNGVLVLSARTGAWHELNEHVLTLTNLKPETISRQITYALTMSPASRKERMDNLKQSVLSNTLANWWHKFGGSFKTAEKVVPMSIKLHHTSRRNMRLAK
jgi:trehalose 6-phosphate synthase